MSEITQIRQVKKNECIISGYAIINCVTIWRLVEDYPAFKNCDDLNIWIFVLVNLGHSNTDVYFLNKSDISKYTFLMTSGAYWLWGILAINIPECDSKNTVLYGISILFTLFDFVRFIWSAWKLCILPRITPILPS
jgi:hypothetical protein